MADKRISQLIERTDILNNDVLPIVASGATTTNKVTISTIQEWMQDNLDVGVTSVGITLGSTGTDVNVTGSPITTSGNITINIPDASTTARGVVTTGSQTFGGVKTFADGLVLPSAGGTNQASRFVNTTAIHQGSAGSNRIGFNSGNNIYFGKGLDNGGVIQWNNAAVRYYTLQDADGTLAFTSQLDGYVTLDTAQTITAQKVFNTSGSSDSVIITHGSGSGIALDVIKAGDGEAIRVTKSSGSGNAMSVSGGNSNFDGGITTTSAVLTSVLQGLNANFTGLVETSDSVRIGTTASIKHNSAVYTLNGFNNIQGNINSFVVTNESKNLRLNFPSVGGLTHTLPDTSGTLALTTDLGAYLPLTGGTLTGALNGTSAAFTGDVTISNPSNNNKLFINRASSAYTSGIFYQTNGTFDFILGQNPLSTGTSDLSIYNYGTSSVVFNIARSTGAATFSSSVTAGGAISINGNFPLILNSISGSTSQQIQYQNNGANKWQIYLNTSNNSLNVFNSTNSSDRLTILESGNVGIGTASPSEKLEVSGTGNQYIKSTATDGSNAGIRMNAVGQREFAIFSDGALRFYDFTLATDRMRVNSVGGFKATNTGNFLNANSAYHELRQGTANTNIAICSNTTSTPFGLDIRYTGASPNSTNFPFISCEDSSELKFLVYSNGNVVNRNNSYGSISDAKLKENIEDATPKLDDLMKVKVRNYNLIGDEKKQIGVIAQELEEVFPAMIDESEDFEEVEVPQVDEEGNEVLNEEGEVVTEKQRVSKGTTTKSVKYSVFVPMLIKAIQELKTEIDSLKNQMQ